MRVHLLLRVLKSAFWIASSVISIVPTTTVKTTVSQQPLQGYYLFEKIYKILILYKMSARSIFELQLSHGFITLWCSASSMVVTDVGDGCWWRFIWVTDLRVTVNSIKHQPSVVTNIAVNILTSLSPNIMLVTWPKTANNGNPSKQTN